jgi:hypothetical protein
MHQGRNKLMGRNGSEAAVSLPHKPTTASGQQAELKWGQEQHVLIAVPGQKQR